MPQRRGAALYLEGSDHGVEHRHDRDSRLASCLYRGERLKLGEGRIINGIFGPGW
jgi:hypothetical protein